MNDNVRRNYLARIGVLCLCAFVAAAPACLATLATSPHIGVTKRIACRGQADCDATPSTAYGQIRTGFKTGIQFPAFCYRFTITNLTTGTLVNVQVTDDQLDLSGCFPTNLPPGGGVTCYVLAEHEFTTTNTVTAIAQVEGTSTITTNQDCDAAIILSTSIACLKTVTSPDDVDGAPNDNHVTLPDDGGEHPVHFGVIVTNPGPASLKEVTIRDPVLEARGVAMPAPFTLLAGRSTNLTLATLSLSCDDLPLSNAITVTGTVASCGIDIQGQPIVVSSQCSGSVGCEGLPRVEVFKEIGCSFFGEACGTFGKSAVGARGDSQDPAFCYRVTVINSGGVGLSNLTVVDDLLGDLTGSFPGTLVVGAIESQIFTASHAASETNRITVEADGAAGTGPVNDDDQAMAEVQQASITCTICASAPDDTDGDPENCQVTLPSDGNAHTIDYSIGVAAGEVPLANVIVRGMGILADCLPAPFSLAANATNVTLCSVSSSCVEIPAGGLTNAIRVTGEADVLQGICGHALDGSPIQVATECHTVLSCAPCLLEIMCPANVVTSLPPGQASVTVNFATETSSSCGDLSVICSPPSGAAFAIGTHPVTCTAISDSGDQDSCEFTVAVLGTLPECPSFNANLTKLKQKCVTKDEATTCVLRGRLNITNDTQAFEPAMLVRFFLSADDTFEPGSDTVLQNGKGLSTFATKKIKPGKTRKVGLKKLILPADSSGLFVHAVTDSDCLIATAQIP